MEVFTKFCLMVGALSVMFVIVLGAVLTVECWGFWRKDYI